MRTSTPSNQFAGGLAKPVSLRAPILRQGPCRPPVLRRFALWTLPLFALSACGESSSGPRVEIAVAPLDLPGVANACYSLSVANGASEPVWSKSGICANAFGDSRGSISYVGPCDASTGVTSNSVTLVLEDLFDATGRIDRNTYQNPCGDASLAANDPDYNYDGFGACELSFTCRENADVPVSFDITVMREANQGFFDVAVNFEDIFCSAKVDCNEPATGDPIELLFNPATGSRDATAVAAFACYSGTTQTVIHMSDVQVVCPLSTYSITPSEGPGNLTLDASTNEILFAAAVYEGVETQAGNGLSTWTVALGIDELALPATGCKLVVAATASEDSWSNGFIPSSHTIYPVMSAAVDISIIEGNLTCGQHPLNGPSSQLVTTYIQGGIYSNTTFCHELVPGASGLTSTLADCAVTNVFIGDDGGLAVLNIEGEFYSASAPADAFVDGDGNVVEGTIAMIVTTDGFNGSYGVGGSDDIDPELVADFTFVDENGIEVQVAPDTLVTIRIPLPPESLYTVGEAIDFYSYDESLQVWELTTTGVVVAEGGRLFAQASVPHFTWYGVQPSKQACVDVTVTDGNGNPLPNINLRSVVVPASGGAYFAATTDNDGTVCLKSRALNGYRASIQMPNLPAGTVVTPAVPYATTPFTSVAACGGACLPLTFQVVLPSACDGIYAAGEECDGGTNCLGDCTCEAGTLSFGDGSCTYCGNGTLDGGELCDPLIGTGENCRADTCECEAGFDGVDGACVPQLDGICGGAGDLDCDGVCNSGDIAPDCDSTCASGEEGSDDCNGLCVLGEEGSGDCNGACATGEDGSTDCNAMCAPGEEGSDDCNGLCVSGEEGSGDCNGQCEGGEEGSGDCDLACQPSENGPDCNGVCDSFTEAGSIDCNDVCEANEGSSGDCNTLCQGSETSAGPDCDGVCQPSEDSASDCNTLCNPNEQGSNDCNTVCDAGETGVDCDGVCVDGDTGSDCNGICQAGEDGSSDCDGTCTVGENGSADCDSFCNGSDTLDGPDCDAICQASESSPVDCNGVCDASETGSNDCNNYCDQGETGSDCDGACNPGDALPGPDCNSVCEVGESGADCDSMCNVGDEVGSNDCNTLCNVGEEGSVDCDGGCDSGEDGFGECNSVCEDGEFGSSDCNSACEPNEGGTTDCDGSCGPFDLYPSPDCDGVCIDEYPSADCNGKCQPGETFYLECDSLCEATEGGSNDCDGFCTPAEFALSDSPDCTGPCTPSDAGSPLCNSVCDPGDTQFMDGGPDCNGFCASGEEGTLDCNDFCEVVDGIGSADCDAVCDFDDEAMSPDCDGDCSLADDAASPDCEDNCELGDTLNGADCNGACDFNDALGSVDCNTLCETSDDPFSYDCDGHCEIGDQPETRDCNAQCDAGDVIGSGDCEGRCDWWDLDGPDCDLVCDPNDDPEGGDCNEICTPNELETSPDCNERCSPGESASSPDCNGLCDGGSMGEEAGTPDCNGFCQINEDGPDCFDGCHVGDQLGSIDCDGICGFMDSAGSEDCNGACDGLENTTNGFNVDCNGWCDQPGENANDCNGICDANFEVAGSADCDTVCSDYTESGSDDCDDICEVGEQFGPDCDGTCEIDDTEDSPDCLLLLDEDAGGTAVAFTTGGTFSVTAPANAFVDPNDNNAPIVGDILLQVNPSPNVGNYAFGGGTLDLETMADIYLLSGGNYVQVAANMSVTVVMPLPSSTSHVVGDEVEVFYFNTTTSTWESAAQGIVVATTDGLGVSFSASHFSIYGVEEGLAPGHNRMAGVEASSTCFLTSAGRIDCPGDRTAGLHLPPSDPGFISLAVGQEAGCALHSVGTIACWGNGSFGLTAAPTGSNFVQIVGGDYHTCALDTAGAITCWGGHPTEGAVNPALLDVPTGIGWREVAASGFGGCALDAAGTPSCWGDTDFSTNPVVASGLSQLALSYDLMCALNGSGQLQCFGANSAGVQLPTSPETEVAQVRMGFEHLMVLRKNGTLGYWKAASPLYEDFSTPPSGGGFSAIGNNRCAMRSDGSTICWGYDIHGGQTRRNDGHSISTVALGAFGGYLLRSDGSLQGWGVDHLAPTGTGYTQLVSDAGNHYCALKPDKDAVCWGDAATVITPAAGPFTMLAGSSGNPVAGQPFRYHGTFCGLRLNGTIACWGNNSDGQATPASGSNFVSVWGYDRYFCGVRSGNAGYSCWGRWGNGNVFGEYTIAKMAGFQCILRTNGTVDCPYLATTGMPTGDGFVDFAEGYDDRFCAVHSTGSLSCWRRSGTFLPNVIFPEGNDFVSIVGNMRAGLCGTRSNGRVSCAKQTEPAGAYVTTNFDLHP